MDADRLAALRTLAEDSAYEPAGVAVRGEDVLALVAEVDRLQAESREQRHIVRHMAGSGILGLNEDGSVWVFGGLPADGSLTYTYGGKDALAPVWTKGERYATADSPFAAAVRRALEDE